MRIESVTNTGDALEIAYAEERDLDYKAGIFESRVLRIAHSSLDPRLLEQLIEAIVEILEAARVQRHRVVDSFQGPR